jgi:hypothetical protein
VGGVRRPHFPRQKNNTASVALSLKVTKIGKTNDIAPTLLLPCGAWRALADARRATVQNPHIFFHKDLLQSGMI